MKRLLRNQVTASSAVSDSHYRLTPTEVVQLLMEIEELKDCDIFIEENPDGSIQFVVGKYTYKVSENAPAPSV